MAHRPQIYADRHAVAAGHPLAAQAAYQILEAGGNATDAGVAAGIMLGVAHSDLVNFGGVAPIMIRNAKSGEVITIDGLGVWPAAADCEQFRRKYDGKMPKGIARTVVPAAPSAWITALKRYGTMSLADVAGAAIDAATNGIGVFPMFVDTLRDSLDEYQANDYKAGIYLPHGRIPRVGERLVQRDLARTLQFLVDAESAAAGRGRDAALDAAHDAFYRGDIATRIAAHYRDNDGLLSFEDLATFRVREEAPLRVRFAGVEILTCGAWCQGISLAQIFAMLERANIGAMRHNSVEYIHTLTEIIKLVFADREQWVGDPAFVDVPVSGMLDSDYADARLALIDGQRAYSQMPPPGDPRSGVARIDAGTAPEATAHDIAATHLDTSYVAVIDAQGNVFSATPSDSAGDAEFIPGLGIAASSRGSQSRTDPAHPSALAAGKRPRLTPNPALALRDGKPYMAFGSPGADVQPQAMVQAFLNAHCFGMQPQDAVEAPRFASYSFPASFAPHACHPARLCVEARIDAGVRDALADRGHDVVAWPEYIWKAGAVSMIVEDDAQGMKVAAADPRRESYALGR